MEYEDRVAISTPEGVDIDLTLAGLGSRVTAVILDSIIQVGAVLVLALFFYLGPLDFLAGWRDAVFIVVTFLFFYGYDIGFEVLGSGRTPGKRATGIRVVLDDGSPIGFVRSAVRNLLRLIDQYATWGIVGSVSILLSSRNKRLGDLAAGSLVVRERKAISELPIVSSPRARVAPSELPAWDASAVTLEEIAAVRGFLLRRDELDWDARDALARRLGEALSAKVVGAPERIPAELFLELLVQVRGAR